MLDQATIAAYDASREIGAQPFRAGCYAPFTSLYFHPTGDVRACCINTKYLLGNVARQRLDDIWNGSAVQIMREAMRTYEFVRGCAHCIWQIRDGNFTANDVSYRPVHAMKYDELPAAADGRYWPTNMEFNLSNVCNLECVMCYGELSSAIRSRREKLPPLPKVYGDEFFADLRKYLPRLRMASFLGGEPFLIREHFVVWDILIEEGATARCCVTTNGTQYNAKIERVLEQLPMAINVSMDGVRAETLEGIRLNVRYDEFMANLRRFHDYCRGKGTNFGLNFTLLRQNWREFREFLQFADSWNCPVSVCTAVLPLEFSLYSLDKDSLRQIVDHWQRQEAASSAGLQVNQPVWDATMAMLAHRLEHFDDDSLDSLYTDALSGPQKMTSSFLNRRADDYSADQTLLIELAQAELGEWAPGAAVDSLECDLEDRLVQVSAVPTGVLALVGDDLLGITDQELFGRLRSQLGELAQQLEESITLDRVDRVVRFQKSDGQATDIRVITIPLYDAKKNLSGTRTFTVRRAATNHR